MTSIRHKLEKNFQPNYLEVEDFSQEHEGHNLMAQQGGTHIKIRIVSDKFIGLDKISRHRLIYSILEQELKDKVHALVIEALTPDENSSSSITN